MFRQHNSTVGGGGGGCYWRHCYLLSLAKINVSAVAVAAAAAVKKKLIISNKIRMKPFMWFKHKMLDSKCACCIFLTVLNMNISNSNPNKAFGSTYHRIATAVVVVLKIAALAPATDKPTALTTKEGTEDTTHSKVQTTTTQRWKATAHLHKMHIKYRAMKY